MKLLISSFNIAIATLCCYFISKYASYLQINTFITDIIPSNYILLFRISDITSACIPMAIVMFITVTTQIMLNEFFEKKVTFSQIFQTVGISYSPLVLYYFFFWYNLTHYCNTLNIKSGSDFHKISFIFNLHFNDFITINLICLIILYVVIIICLIHKKIGIIPAFISTLLPSSIFLLVLNLIKYYS